MSDPGGSSAKCAAGTWKTLRQSREATWTDDIRLTMLALFCRRAGLRSGSCLDILNKKQG